MDFDRIEKMSNDSVNFEYDDIISSTCYCNCRDGRIGIDVYASDTNNHVCSSYHAQKACNSSEAVYCKCSL